MSPHHPSVEATEPGKQYTPENLLGLVNKTVCYWAGETGDLPIITISIHQQPPHHLLPLL